MQKSYNLKKTMSSFHQINISTYSFTVQNKQTPQSQLRSLKTTAMHSIRRRIKKFGNFPKSVLMQQAITDGDLQQIIQLICEHGKCIVNIREPSGLSPAMRCVFESRTAALQILVEAGANLSHRDSENWTALHVAASMDDVPAAKYILKRCRKDLTQLCSVDGEKPIDLAQSPAMVRLLQFAESMTDCVIST